MASQSKEKIINDETNFLPKEMHDWVVEQMRAIENRTLSQDRALEFLVFLDEYRFVMAEEFYTCLMEAQS